jgi:hypothetical protein
LCRIQAGTINGKKRGEVAIETQEARTKRKASKMYRASDIWWLPAHLSVVGDSGSHTTPPTSERLTRHGNAAPKIIWNRSTLISHLPSITIKLAERLSSTYIYLFAWEFSKIETTPVM